MSKGHLLSCVFISFLSASPSMAQVTSPIPDFFDQFINNYYLVNPANTDQSYKLKLMVGDKSQSGLFKGINKIYFDADLKAKTSRKDAHHFLGCQVINYREGEFINLSRLFGRYSWRTRISEKASLSAGLSLGFLNYSFKASQASAGGSAASPDGSVGMWYLRENAGIGFSVQQMFQGRIQPVNQSYDLFRNYNLNAYRKFALSPYVNLSTHVYYGLHKTSTPNIALITVLEVQEKIDLALNYRHNRGLIFMAGLRKINLGPSAFSLYFSYLVPTGKVSVRDNALEINLSFQK